MAITVKDTYGNPETVSSNGKANLGVALGAIGTGLGVLNGGLGGLFGGNGYANGYLNGTGAGVGAGVNMGTVANIGAVAMTKYYEDRIQDIKDINSEFTSVREDICRLRERASVGETANMYQNMLTQQAFGFVDKRFTTERQITDFEIGAATCDFIRGTKVVTPAQLGTTYANPTMVLDQHEIRYLDERRHHRHDGCGCDGFRDGWGYDGYRGF